LRKWPVMTGEPHIRLDRNLSYNLALLTFLMGKASSDIYDSRELTSGQWKVLSVLAAFGPMAAVEIGKRVTLDKAAISRAVRQLRELKLASYRSHAVDGRCLEVILTAKGRRTYQAMNDEMMELQERIFEGVSRDHQRVFFATADKLLTRLRTELLSVPEEIAGAHRRSDLVLHRRGQQRR
jgi:DNA-binding MarR family transcriptional regulator